MKLIITLLSTAAVLTVAIAASGFAFDGAVVISICAASALVGMFIGDYSRTPRCNLDPVKTPARASKRLRHPEAGGEFATSATFHPMVG